MPAETSPLDQATQALRVSAIRLLCRGGRRPRVAMRGTSMLPVLREPMTLEIEQPVRRPQIGEVVVFEQNAKLIAHRVVAHAGENLITAGDAVPNTIEVVTPEQLVGTVARVWSDASAAARPLDGWQYAARGAVVAYRRSARLRLGVVRRSIESALRPVNCRARARAFGALYKATGAIVNRDPEALERVLRGIAPVALLEMARRHRCAAFLSEGIERLGLGAKLAPSLRAELQTDRWSTAMRTAAMRRQVVDVVRTLRERGVDPILLKGAARLYAEDAGAALHESCDIDVLLTAGDLERAAAALRETGYRSAAGADAAYANHHHAAPLFPPKTGVPVELHRALASGNVLVRTDADSLRRFARRVYGPAGPAFVLRDLGAALHLLIHSRELSTLRDLVLLAERLRRLTVAERRELRRIVDGEDAERLRLHGMLYGAARLAGLDWPAPPRARRYFAWRLRRGDLPLPLLERCEAVEMYYATGGRRLRPVLSAMLPHRASEPRTGLRRAMRLTLVLIARTAINVCSAAYAALMREPA